MDISNDSQQQSLEGNDQQFLFLLVAAGSRAPHGLLLEPTTSKEHKGDVYERIGYAHGRYEISNKRSGKWSPDDSDSDTVLIVEDDNDTQAWKAWTSLAERKELIII
jgi:hypothetical protein